MAELHSCYPSSPSDKGKKAPNERSNRIHRKRKRKRDEIRESSPAHIPPPVARRLLHLRPLWAETSRHQSPPGSPSPCYPTSPWRAAQKLACVSIGLLSTQSLFLHLSRGFSAGLSIGCSGGRDVPASGPLSCLRRHTTNTCRCLGVRTVLGTCPPVRVQTSVGRTWLPGASHCSLGRVSCCQHCLSDCSCDAYCICRPPTPPSPPSWLLRFVRSCSPPMCILALVLCLLCDPLSVDLLGDLLPHFRGCQCVLKPIAPVKLQFIEPSGG